MRSEPHPLFVTRVAAEMLNATRIVAGAARAQVIERAKAEKDFMRSLLPFNGGRREMFETNTTDTIVKWIICSHEDDIYLDAEVETLGKEGEITWIYGENLLTIKNLPETVMIAHKLMVARSKFKNLPKLTSDQLIDPDIFGKRKVIKTYPKEDGLMYQFETHWCRDAVEVSEIA